ncbi:MAG TPA: NADPH-dependent glutamate synthase [Kiritimatiellia bacterium]|jgi:glutamate synthase (NADPH/NADH) small chain|nr:NADPH-dependent glutamate synthase [Kiritimatiellia bacterium]MBP9571586.1 NADPH-dependent glutamate synthase [Kiritimatiellia bacterium]HOR74998.1 NADPH-dependent glutamate synthase [Kiritimatiellia bacterium]HPK69964.1 NADPH-dependent glutamate synthase [Kiritimatiellia bacterium]HQF19812.1 NADPH-dependent glutamate synthase [Kiritimatiellia bacterium]
MTFQTPASLQEAARQEWARIQTLPQPLKPRDRLAIPPQEMPAQDPLARAKNMREVALGYFEEQMRVEASRCLQCKNAPCVAGCPVRIDIPRFIAALAAGDPATAIAVIKETSLLPAVCGRVCPQETQCQAPCTVGKSLKSVDKAVAIGRLERYAADWERLQGQAAAPEVAPETGKKVAVVGSGPAGITVAADVRRAGHAVVLFEAFHKAGGVLVYGIPEFRLPKEIVRAELDTLRRMGVELRTNFVVGRTRKVTDLIEKDGFDAVFIGSGAGLPKFMNIPGENLVGVYSANEYLTRSNLMRAYDREHAVTPIHAAQRVAVLGGGNVAMDAARTALRLGASEVHLIYRRTEAEMPARVEEVAHAKEEGVQFHILQNAKRILGENGKVTGIECLRYELGEPDASGRRRPVEIPGSEFQLPMDAVIVAIGNESNPLIEQTTPGLAVDKNGHIVTDENGRTSLPRVFAGGDIVLGAATVILAMGEGRKAAAAINELLRA